MSTLSWFTITLIFGGLFWAGYYIYLLRYMARYPQDYGFDSLWSARGIGPGWIGGGRMMILLGPGLFPLGLVLYWAQPPWRRKIIRPFILGFIVLVVMLTITSRSQ